MPPNATQRLLYNITGQSLVFDASSRPSSITSVTVYHRGTGDGGTAESATTGSASIETNPNTTFDAASGKSQADQHLLNLAATTGITAGRSYLATDAEGQTEWVDILGVTSGASARARTPLVLDYVNGDSFVSTRVSISVDSTWIAALDNISESGITPGYRVRWVWVDAGSTTHVDYTDFDVVRYVNDDHGITPADMDRFMPGWSYMLPDTARGDGGQALIDAAYERVQDDLFAMEVADYQIRNRDMLGRIVRYAAQRQLFWASMTNGGDPERFTAADAEYQGMFNKVFRVETRVALDVDEDGATNLDASPGGIWKR